LLPRSVRDDETVDEITRRSPRALAVLRDFGINHCCGAHLTLTQAAAAAGVPVERLVRALDDAIHTEA
jgi:iron-sulfur cluster repair protein YtfE (RIC family)